MNKENGFTLVEVLFALVIASLTFGGYIGATVLAQRNTEEMNERTIAIQDANRAVEQIRNASRTTSPAFPANVIAAYPDGSVVNPTNNLTDEIITASYADTAANPLDVTITVTWTSYTQRASSISIRTYITQR